MDAQEEVREGDEVAMETTVYTRGRPGDEDNRGSSMVQKHLEKLQLEKEDAAMSKLHGLMPQLGSIVRDLALKETEWCVEKAALLLRRFQVANASKLSQLHKKRKRILNALANRAKKSRMGSDSSSDENGEASESSLSSQAASDFSDPEKDRARHKSPTREKKQKRVRSGGKHLSARKDRSKDKRRRSSKKSRDVERPRSEKKRKQRKEEAPASYQYGKYGVIRESDWSHKRSEFVCWASDVKGIDVETMPRAEEKDLFREYVEDFNTGTLPHRKYYDLEMYERQVLEKTVKKKRVKMSRERERVTFNDEEERRRELQTERAKQQEDRVREAYEEMRRGEKAEDMREQELLRLQMSLAYKTGDTRTVEKLADRLRPDDGKETRKNLDG
ncbi:hypothetical protein BSKO_07096 [Bryopsis sp. KO-2023]|nr:hypothetical protein BSKO_07096 [Bryopsis sp. KO-2023]